MGVDGRTRDVELSVVMERPAGDETPRELELSNAFERADDGEIFSLPDADRGQAWLFLASAVVFEAVTWGFPFSFGVFQPYYTQHFADNGSSIAAIGTTATGLLYVSAPFWFTVLKLNPRYRRPSVFVGFAVIVAALIGASFAQSVSQLIATQGVLYAVGGALHYYPVLLYLDEWFVAKRGLAFGVICASCGAGGVVIPFALDWVLRNYGFRTALRTWTVVFVVLTTPALFYMKPRLPIRHHANTGPQRLELGYLKSKTFWILQGASIIQGLGFFLPSIYLSSFAQKVGFSAVDGTLAIALINAAQIVGALFIGFLCDRCHVTTGILVCSIGTVVAVFVFWTFATLKPMLFVFAILYGVYAGGYSTTWSGVAKTVRENGYPGAETGMIISLFSCGKGIGAVVSGPLSEALVDNDPWNSSAPYAFGTGYGALLLMTGITAFVGGFAFYAKQLKMIH
ncbi:MFS general substrate transporter [Aureobasidium pullulans]|nr:MFS general substrate transporter [Aureobasidium pullulans]